MKRWVRVMVGEGNDGVERWSWSVKAEMKRWCFEI
jgi:hypothetical protein